MRIYIPTRRRVDRQVTSSLLIACGVPHVLVHDSEDVFTDHPLRTHLIDAGTGIRDCRNRILEDASTRGVGKIMVIDDDITFRRRVHVEERGREDKFVRATPDDVSVMLGEIDALLDTHAHVGLIDEFMCQHQPRGVKHHGRYNSVVAFNLDLWPKPWPQYRLEVNEDHDVSLQLQAAGLAPAIMCEWTRTTKPYAVGGCATWRDAATELRGHEGLAALWPDLVRLVPNAKALSGQSIRVNWQKAAAQCAEALRRTS